MIFSLKNNFNGYPKKFVSDVIFSLHFLMRSLKQKQQFAEAKKKRHLSQNYQGDAFQIDPLRYCLAALSEGLGETQSRRFLAKLILILQAQKIFTYHKIF